MALLRLEFTVEPFVPGDPGPHVRRAIEAVESLGLAVDVGPFSSSVTADAGRIADALHRLTTSAFDHGASRLSLQLERAEVESA